MSDHPTEPTTTPLDGPDQGVQATLGLLDGLNEVPVADHVAVFEQVHDQLRQMLAGSSTTPGAGTRGG